MRLAVALVVVVGSTASADLAAINGDMGGAVFFWHRPPPPPTTTKSQLLMPPSGADVASFAWRTGWTYQGKSRWFIGDDFDFNPMAMVGWRAHGGYMARLACVRPYVGLAAAAGMFFDANPAKFGVSALAYVSAMAGARVFVGKILTLGAGVERTIVSTRTMWIGLLTIGVGFEN
jgi:hypothetical protein